MPAPNPRRPTPARSAPLVAAFVVLVTAACASVRVTELPPVGLGANGSEEGDTSSENLRSHIVEPYPLAKPDPGEPTGCLDAGLSAVEVAELRFVPTLGRPEVPARVIARLRAVAEPGGTEARDHCARFRFLGAPGASGGQLVCDLDDDIADGLIEEDVPDQLTGCPLLQGSEPEGRAHAAGDRNACFHPFTVAVTPVEKEHPNQPSGETTFFPYPSPELLAAARPHAQVSLSPKPQGGVAVQIAVDPRGGSPVELAPEQLSLVGDGVPLPPGAVRLRPVGGGAVVAEVFRPYRSLAVSVTPVNRAGLAGPSVIASWEGEQPVPEERASFAVRDVTLDLTPEGDGVRGVSFSVQGPAGAMSVSHSDASTWVAKRNHRRPVPSRQVETCPEPPGRLPTEPADGLPVPGFSLHRVGGDDGAPETTTVALTFPPHQALTQDFTVHLCLKDLDNRFLLYHRFAFDASNLRPLNRTIGRSRGVPGERL